MSGVLHLLTGCTACGKTEAALAWAERNDAEILSCDALLFYRGMDIGTAKPAAAERVRVPHHLVDVCEASETMDVKTYVGLAQAAVRGIEARGRRVLVAGGSGFYLRSFLAPVADDVPVDGAVRREVEEQLAREGLPALVRRLEALNPAGLGGLDVQNPRRVVRALERCVVSRESLAELARRFREQPAPFGNREVRIVEVTREPEDLRARIAARARAMIAAGLVEEVRALRAGGFEKNRSAASAIGYRETLAWLDAGAAASTDELAGEIAAGTWRLVRKQRTWFRTQLPPHRTIALAPGAAVDARTLFE